MRAWGICVNLFVFLSAFEDRTHEHEQQGQTALTRMRCTSPRMVCRCQPAHELAWYAAVNQRMSSHGTPLSTSA
eukprot:362110-Chlamydomonas_euryale.AAC.6